MRLDIESGRWSECRGIARGQALGWRQRGGRELTRHPGSCSTSKVGYYSQFDSLPPRKTTCDAHRKASPALRSIAKRRLRTDSPPPLFNRREAYVAPRHAIAVNHQLSPRGRGRGNVALVRRSRQSGSVPPYKRGSWSIRSRQPRAGWLARNIVVTASLTVVRHGATEWSTLGRHTSRADVALLPEGEKEAIALESRLRGRPFTLVLTSPRRRAIDTARLAGFPDAVIDPNLSEWDYGADEGRTTAEIRVDRPNWDAWRDGFVDGEPLDHSRRGRRVSSAPSPPAELPFLPRSFPARLASPGGLPPCSAATFPSTPRRSLCSAGTADKCHICNIRAIERIRPDSSRPAPRSGSRNALEAIADRCSAMSRLAEAPLPSSMLAALADHDCVGHVQWGGRRTVAPDG